MTAVLVTGVGAIIGYGILRSLRQLNRGLFLIGCDIHEDAVGQAWADRFLQAPPTSSPHYLGWLQTAVAANKVDLVVPGIEQDVHFLSDNRHALAELGVSIVLNDRRLIDLSRDKWLMHQELSVMGCSARIPSYLEGSFERLSRDLGLPFIVKPRRGYASKGLLRVRNEEEYHILAGRLGSELLAQPIIGSDDEEYTVGVFGNGEGGACASIALQRQLAADGSTAKARVRKVESLNFLVDELCSHFKPLGPTNLQFRRGDEGWKLLEINPRISSSTSLRTAFGYNEAGMSLAFYIDGTLPEQPLIRNGFAARYIEDWIVHDRDHF